MTIHFSFILVSTLHAGNIGSAARALANMGFKDLRLVAPRCSPKDSQAIALAMGGLAVLKKVKIYATVAEAIADSQLVLATACQRAYRPLKRISSRDLASSLEAEEGIERVALLFGPEEKGLSNEDLSYCDRVITIPTSRETPSINLAQSVLIVSYELARLQKHKVRGLIEKPARKKSVEGMIAHLEEILWQVGYMDKQNPYRNRVVLRSLFGRARPTEGEIYHLRAIYRKVLRGLGC